MFVIREVHKEALRRAAVERFAVELGPKVARAFPMRWAALDDAGEALVKQAVARAVELGLSERGSLQRFVELAFGLDPEVGARPSHDWIREVLSHPELPERERFEVLQDALEARGLVVYDAPAERQV